MNSNAQAEGATGKGELEDVVVPPFTSTTGPFWPGYEAINELIVFGASYCAISTRPLLPHPAPTPTLPLGVPYPGETWTEGRGDHPNWVGWLVKWRYEGGGESGTGLNVDAEGKNPLLVYNYALGGETVEGVAGQVGRAVEKFGRGGEEGDARRRLFATWVGINDCAQTIHNPHTATPHPTSISTLLTLHHTLYTTCSARNFLIIDVPPMHRAPLYASGFDSGTSSSMSLDDIASVYATWNAHLRTRLHAFRAEHPDASVMLFSAWDLFNEVLDDPVGFGVGDSSQDNREGGDEEDELQNPPPNLAGFWADMIHPTSRVHAIIAGRIKELLQS